MAEAAVIIGTIVSAGAAVRQGNLAENAAKKDSQIHAMNAEIAVDNARKRADQIRRQGRHVLAEARASQGSTAGSLEGATFLEIQAETARTVEGEAMNAIFAGDVERFNFQGRAANSRFQGAIAKQAGLIGAAGALSSGAFNLDKMGFFDQFSQTKTTGLAKNWVDPQFVGGGQGPSQFAGTVPTGNKGKDNKLKKGKE